MREIKFRAWEKDSEEMFYPDTTNNNEQFFSGFVDGVLRVATSPYSSEKDYELMQYTGLKDRNYREVYEGDIVETYDAMSELYTGVVEYESEFANFIVRTKEGWKFSLDNMCEVIGNIYENHSTK